jgi:hypothetical protein
MNTSESQHVPEKILNITHHQRNANKSHNVQMAIVQKLKENKG